MSTKLDEYEAALEESRQGLTVDPAIAPLFSVGCEDRLFARWMLRYNAHGVHMTHDVERWIAGAGERCAELGMDRLGKALKAHARAEAGHDRMMVDDTKAIANWWEERFGGPVDADALLAQPPLASAGFYGKLHEQVIAGPVPFAQLAIEYEIERLSITIGPILQANCRRIFGPDTSCYSFLAEHVELDVGHTAFNQRQLDGILTESPEHLGTMVETGKAALASYAAFMAECMGLAQGDLEAERVSA